MGFCEPMFTQNSIRFCALYFSCIGEFCWYSLQRSWQKHKRDGNFCSFHFTNCNHKTEKEKMNVARYLLIAFAQPTQHSTSTRKLWYSFSFINTHICTRSELATCRRRFSYFRLLSWDAQIILANSNTSNIRMHVPLTYSHRISFSLLVSIV